MHDVGGASMCLALQAVEEGVAVHQMAGFDAEKAHQLFGLPQDCAAVTMLAVGYPGPMEGLSDRHRAKEVRARERLPLSAIVYHGKWGAALDDAS
jgi:hypothetical protein